MAQTGVDCARTLDQDDQSDLLQNCQVSIPELLGFSKEFKEALESVGGCCHSLAAKLLDSHTSENSSFVAGKLCSTREQKDFYTKTLDAGPMVSRWIETGYEIPFNSVPSQYLYASNNKSMSDNIQFAWAEIQRQVSMGILSEVP